MNVSVIIVNYNTKELTKNCLASIFEKTKNIDFEVIVSDNGSTDGSIEMIKSDFPQVVLIENNANLGFGKANNIAAKIAKGKYLLFLNSDTILLNNAVKEFFDMAVCEKNKILGCILVNEIGTPVHSYERFTPFFKAIFRTVVQTYPILTKIHLLKKKEINDSNNKINNDDIQFIIGADLFVSANNFFALSGFDENFFMFFEDEDLCRRAAMRDIYCDIVDTPRIAHLESKSTKIKSKKIEFFEHSLFIYSRKYYTKFSYSFIRILFFVYSIFRMFDFRFSLKERISMLKNIIL